ncbi:MAG: hypothetical protein AABY07_00905 [Nanoarchaeota archaeon]
MKLSLVDRIKGTQTVNETKIIFAKDTGLALERMEEELSNYPQEWKRSLIRIKEL